MATGGWEPFRNILTLQDRMNRMFEEAVAGPRRGGEEEEMATGQWAPPVDIFETSDQIVIRAEVPGIEQNTLGVEVKDDRLILEGHRQFEEVAGRNYHRVERAYGGFRRTFALPTMVRQDQVRAVLKNGVLEITLPKEERSRPKQVEVEVR